jgi:predicted ester cyclase
VRIVTVAPAPVDLVRAAVDKLNAGDIDGYLSYCHPSSVRRVIGVDEPFSYETVGEGLRQLSHAFEGFTLTADALFGDDRQVCARWRIRGRHVRDYLGIAPAGRSIDLECCEVYDVRDGLVVGSVVYQDLALIFTQIAPQEKASA